MRKYKYAMFIAAGVMIVGTIAWMQLRGAAERFQQDADVARLQHLKYYGMLIEEYFAKTGRYPFEGKSDVPVYVHIANDRQAAFANKGPPYRHELVPFSALVKELESALGRTIDEHYDPQYYPVNKPNFYVYMVHKDAYFFAVHLHQDFPFVEKIGDHHYKAEISNAANNENKARLPAELFDDPDFVKAVQKPMFKPDFFEERDRKYLHFTKRG